MTIAGGIAAALFRRERTGEASVVDVSLLGVGMWTTAPDIVAAEALRRYKLPMGDRAQMPNPLVNTYRTKDGRRLLMMLQPDRSGPSCRPPRPPRPHRPIRASAAGRPLENRERVRSACSTRSSRRRTFAEWRERARRHRGRVGAVQKPTASCYDDPQVLANGYLGVDHARASGDDVPLVPNPSQFDEEPARADPRARPRRAHRRGPASSVCTTRSSSRRSRTSSSERPGLR